MSSNVRLWAAISIALGVVILLAGTAQHADETLRPFERGGIPILIGEGAALAGLALLVLAGRRRLQVLLVSDEERETSERGSYRARPYTTLFLVSFVALFIEVMLIRYCSAQIRIFSYYKNVPLVSCFLGLGLGCCLGNGRSRHALLFLLWLTRIFHGGFHHGDTKNTEKRSYMRNDQPRVVTVCIKPSG